MYEVVSALWWTNCVIVALWHPGTRRGSWGGSGGSPGRWGIVYFHYNSIHKEHFGLEPLPLTVLPPYLTLKWAIKVLKRHRFVCSGVKVDIMSPVECDQSYLCYDLNDVSDFQLELVFMLRHVAERRFAPPLADLLSCRAHKHRPREHIYKHIFSLHVT